MEDRCSLPDHCAWGRDHYRNKLLAACGKPLICPDKCKGKRPNGIAWVESHASIGDPGFRYFVLQGQDRIKIGSTVSLERRIKTLQTGSPVKLVLLAFTNGGATVERLYHSRFVDSRLEGEWFLYTREIRAEVQRLNRISRKMAA